MYSRSNAILFYRVVTIVQIFHSRKITLWYLKNRPDTEYSACRSRIRFNPHPTVIIRPSDKKLENDATYRCDVKNAQTWNIKNSFGVECPSLLLSSATRRYTIFFTEFIQ